MHIQPRSSATYYNMHSDGTLHSIWDIKYDRMMLDSKNTIRKYVQYDMRQFKPLFISVVALEVIYIT